MSIVPTDGGHVSLYDSEHGWAFGPVFGSNEHAEDFVAWFADRFNVENLDLLDSLSLSPQGWRARYDEWEAERLDFAGCLIEVAS